MKWTSWLAKPAACKNEILCNQLIRTESARKWKQYNYVMDDSYLALCGLIDQSSDTTS